MKKVIKSSQEQDEQAIIDLHGEFLDKMQEKYKCDVFASIDSINFYK